VPGLGVTDPIIGRRVSSSLRSWTRRLVLFSQRNRDDAFGDRGVGGIGRVVLARLVEGINLEKDFVAIGFERTEVVFFVRIVGVAEIVVDGDRLDDARDSLGAKCCKVALANANGALAMVHACLELGDVNNINDQDRSIVQGYNQDDCISTWQLRDWLEDRRAELIARGISVDRPLPKAGEAAEDLSKRQQKIARLVKRLTSDVPRM